MPEEKKPSKLVCIVNSTPEGKVAVPILEDGLKIIEFPANLPKEDCEKVVEDRAPKSADAYAVVHVKYNRDNKLKTKADAVQYFRLRDIADYSELQEEMVSFDQTRKELGLMLFELSVLEGQGKLRATRKGDEYLYRRADVEKLKEELGEQ